jgi:hypothetical protein
MLRLILVYDRRRLMPNLIALVSLLAVHSVVVWSAHKILVRESEYREYVDTRLIFEDDSPPGDASETKTPVTVTTYEIPGAVVYYSIAGFIGLSAACIAEAYFWWK